ncbi:MAG: hypothetical protein Q9210_004589 [Variospora velana]
MVKPSVISERPFEARSLEKRTRHLVDTYSYTSLPDQYIRLLELLPGAFEEQICIKLVTVKLTPQQIPSYHALSYAWGSPTFDHDIKILSDNSFHLLSVTQNLHTALRYLRWSSASRILWTDAVCINQTDTEERSQQVARMADIYRSADKVVIWLGPEENGSDLALSAMATLASEFQVDWNRFPIPRAYSEDTDSSWLDLNNPKPFDHGSYSSIVFLLERPWLLDLTEEVSEDFLWECCYFLYQFYDNVVGRAFILTQNEGLIGLAPEACRENDCIVVLLGCPSPMVLRATDDGSLLVVGECYVQGLMDGEALLGPLPSNWRRVGRFDEETKRTWNTFKDCNRAVYQIEDPRLGPLPKGWCEEKHPKEHVYALFRDKTTDVVDWHDLRMLPSFLRDRGVEIQEFNHV